MMENSNNLKKLKKNALLAFKLSIGTSLAIFIATRFGLNNTVSAGTIALLTLMGTKWETVRLSFYRLFTFAITICVAWAVSLYIDNVTIAYGAFVFFLVLITSYFGWKTTISVNAVAGAHLFITHDFSMASIQNEFILVLIGIVLALVLNLFQINSNQRVSMIANMRRTEEDLQNILRQMADYLQNLGEHTTVWSDIKDLESRLSGYTREAYEYQDNTLQSHPVYYIDYFEMRYDQCQVLHSLHASMKQIRTVPDQAKVVADFILYLTDYVIEKNHPEEQEIRLGEVFAGMKQEELPKSREEFESRALLYHILMDLESFLDYKRKFVEKLDEKQLDRYWRNLSKAE